MKYRDMFRAMVLITLLYGQGACADAAPVLSEGDRVAIIGDSITEQKIYSRYIELYLTVCQPQLRARVCQLGWSGERAAGFQPRMENDLLPFHPHVVTLCFGMNDGNYRPYTPAIGEAYAAPMRAIMDCLTNAGVKVVVGGPGVVDAVWFRRFDPEVPSPEVYNANLANLSAIAAELARETRQPFADVHGAMQTAMSRSQTVLGREYDVAGRDGIHPRENGQLVMAYAFLKAMGFDGDLGSIYVDWGRGTARAEGGHNVISFKDGQAILESVRYPFCFTGDEKSPDGTRSMLPYVPFNRDLNRLMLIVRNASAARYTLTWGSTSRVFEKAELERGVNLADAFLDNPFQTSFAAVEKLIAAKQSYETAMIKQCITGFRLVRRECPPDEKLTDAMRLISDSLWNTQADKSEAIRAAFQPVQHTLIIQAAP
jgi:lysophospholipase L1-like esterase